jgi:hypothetical protein
VEVVAAVEAEVAEVAAVEVAAVPSRQGQEMAKTLHHHRLTAPKPQHCPKASICLFWKTLP